MTKPPAPGALDPFSQLQPKPGDSLLSLIKAFRDDPRAMKIDLGVGVYRDAGGRTPVFAAVKEAEARLVAEQATKTYLGPEGDLEFLDCLVPVIFGHDRKSDDLVGIQTPGGTGALRIAAELANRARPGARIWVGTPTWPNHLDIFAGAGLSVATYPYFDPIHQEITVDGITGALEDSEPGDLILLHGCCHNPTGADLSLLRWDAIARHIADKRLLPLIDFAYQGLGDGLEEDAAGLRRVFDVADNAILAYSCDKNFGLYRERTGALFVQARRNSDLVRANVLALTRAAWSMPPDHGAATVRLVLGSTNLRREWEEELAAMRLRLNAVRRDLAQMDRNLAALRDQRGLFALLPLSAAQIETLRRDWAIYAVGSGRINIAGLNTESMKRFTEALQAVSAEHGGDRWQR